MGYSKQELEFVRTCARREAAEVLAKAAATFEQAAAEMRRYAGMLDRMENDTRRADVMGWAINHCAANVLGNVRLDLMAKVGAELATVDAREQEQKAA